jgi:flagellar M-ring protein FliF
MVADDAVALPGAAPQLEAPRASVHLASARAVAKENPAAVANIVRDWVNGEK